MALSSHVQYSGIESVSEQWREHGYLLLPSVLDAGEVNHLLAAVEELELRYIQERSSVNLGRAGNSRDLLIRNIFHETSAADHLIDHQHVFKMLIRLMGPYLSVLGAEILVRYPSAEPLLRFHADGGSALQQILPTDDNPSIQLKVQFFLTSTSSRDHGNFMLVPGSHMERIPVSGLLQEDVRSRAIQICAEPGDCIIFPWTLWHGVAAHEGQQARKSLILRYGQLWCRPYEPLDATILERLSERQKLLLGYLGKQAYASDYYTPDNYGYVERMLGDDWDDDLSVKHRLLEISKRFKTPA